MSGPDDKLRGSFFDALRDRSRVITTEAGETVPRRLRVAAAYGWRILVIAAVLKGAVAGAASAEVGYWTAAHARGRGVASRSLEAMTRWAFDTFGGDGLQRLDLLHQADNVGSCGVARKAGYAFDRILPASPPAFPLDGHLHARFGPVPGATVTA